METKFDHSQLLLLSVQPEQPKPADDEFWY